MTRDKTARGKSTISDVAARAGVSVGTVSNVLSGHIHVSDQLRQRVMEAVEELGFVPNVHAQGLRQRASKLVGLCLPHVSTTYASALSEGLEDVAAAAGYGVVHVFSRQRPEAELRRVQDLVRLPVEGLILFPSLEPHATLDFIRSRKLPVVMIDHCEDVGFDQVVLDNAVASKAVARHFYALGHRRLLLVCRSRRYTVPRHRYEGLMEAVEELAPQLNVDCLEYENDDRLLVERLTALLRSPSRPTAIVTSNSHQAAIVMATLQGLGVNCPGEISLIGFDDSDWSGLVEPRLSVIRQPARRIIELAWGMLQRRMAGVSEPPGRQALALEIAYRGSVGPALAKASAGGVMA